MWNIDSYPYKYIEVSKEIKKKVSAISALDNIISLGTEDGYLYSYYVNETNDGFGTSFELDEVSEEVKEGSKRGNDKILKIQIIPAQYLITLLVDKSFYMVTMDSHYTVQHIKTKEIKNNVYMYAIQKKNDLFETIDPIKICLAIATNKNIYFWRINQEFKFEEEKDESTGEARKIHFGDKIYALEWVENTLYVGTKSSYLIIDAKSGTTMDIKITCPTKEPQLSVVSNSLVSLLEKGGKVWGYNKNIDKITRICEDLVGENIRLQAHNLNLVVMSDRELRVYSPEKNIILQDFGKIMDSGAKYTAIGCKKHEVIIAYNPNPSNRKFSKTIIKILKEAPIDQQIARLLKVGEDKEAERIFYIGNKGKPNLDDLKKEFELNTGWIKFFNRLDFESASYHLINGKIDPRELIFYFGYNKYCKDLSDCLSKQPNLSIEKFIEIYVNEKHIKLDIKTTVKKAKDNLLNVINNWYWDLSKETNDDIVKFNYSSYSETHRLIKEEYKNLRISDILPLLKTITIFILADIGYHQELEKALMREQAFYQEEVAAYLMRLKKKEPLAIYYEGTGDIINSLKTWQEIGDDRAITKTISIISRSNLNKEELFKYWRWVIREKPDQVINILLQYEKTSISPETVIEFLRDWDSDQPLVLNYLSQFISKREDTSQSLHNSLAFEYIQQIYEIKNPSKDYNAKWNDEETLEMNRQNFRTFLNESNYYSASLVLNKIKNSWMMEEIILLLVKSGQHSQALESYLDKNMIKEAEEFWVNMDPKLNLITTLFEIYITRFKKWDEKCDTIKNQSLGPSEFAAANEKRQTYEASAMNLLKQYACHPSLDSIKVLELIPENWLVSKGRSYSLMKFLKTLFDHKLTLQENNAIGEGLSKIELINTECKVAEKKKAHVRITSDFIWPLCKSRLEFDKIYVYPDGTVVHKHCGIKAEKENGNLNIPFV